MSIIKGAKEIRSSGEDREKREKRSEFGWFKLAKSGDAAVVRFLQEIDYDSDNYVEEAGVSFIAVVLQPPVKEGWKYRYFLEEDSEGLLDEVGDWAKKPRFFTNLVVVKEDGTEELCIWDAQKQVGLDLVDWSDELGSITNRTFKVRRSGEGTDTKYMLMPQAEDSEPYDVTKHELVDIEERLLKPLTKEEIAKFAGSEKDDGEESEWM